MTEKVEILRDSAIDTLRRNGVTVTETAADGDTPLGDKSYTLQKGDILESHTLPPLLGRRKLHYFQRHFGISIHLFFSAPEVPPAPVTVIRPTKTA